MGGTFQDLLWEELRSDDVITAQDCNSLDTVFEFAARDIGKRDLVPRWQRKQLHPGFPLENGWRELQYRFAVRAMVAGGAGLH